jgi:hypothetical protein
MGGSAESACIVKIAATAADITIREVNETA